MPRFRTCIDCGTIADNTRCPDCRTRVDRTKRAKRPDLHNATHRRIRRDAIAAHPWCARCNATSDLTLDHVAPASTLLGFQVLCRSCNSSKGARTGGHPRDGIKDPGA